MSEGVSEGPNPLGWPPWAAGGMKQAARVCVRHGEYPARFGVQGLGSRVFCITQLQAESNNEERRRSRVWVNTLCRGHALGLVAENPIQENPLKGQDQKFLFRVRERSLGFARVCVLHGEYPLGSRV